jgi:acetyl-CoA carboxylase carboxyl transferase subunit alpha
LLELGVIDQIVPEPMGGAHREPAAAIASVGAAIASALDAFAEFDSTQIRHQRRDRFLAIGRFEEEASASA